MSASMNGRTATAAALLFLAVASVHGQDALHPAETCAGTAGQGHCWKQLRSHPGCYVWNSEQRATWIASWTGACSGSFADGEGTLTWRYPGSGRITFEGVLAAGRLHGRVRETQGGTVSEGSYAGGERTGAWVSRTADGDVWEGTYINGKLHGTTVFRRANGDVSEARYVNGERQPDP